MSQRYAARTSVPVDRSKAEIEATLRRYGADQFGYAAKSDAAKIAFVAHGRRVEFVLPFPDPNAKRFWTRNTRGGLRPRHSRNESDYQQEVRQRWRALALCIKAKLEAVEAGIVSFEAEFMAHIVIPGHGRIGEFLLPKIEQAYAGQAVDLLDWDGGR